MQARKVDMSTKKILHEYHDVFYKLLGIPFDWVCEDYTKFTVCGYAHCNPLCRRIHSSKEGKAMCDNLTVTYITHCRKHGTPLSFVCHAGLTDTVVPIFVGDSYVGSMCVGQFLQEKPSAKEIHAVAEKLKPLNITRDELKKYYAGTPVLAPDKLEGLIELLKMIGGYICESQMKLNFLQSIHQSDVVGAAIQYMEMNHKSQMPVKTIAKKVGISGSYLTHLFTKQTGMSPVRFLNSLRIKKAIELLEETDLYISQIAFAVGFQSIQHFNRIFKKMMKKSPSDYRR